MENGCTCERAPELDALLLIVLQYVNWWAH